MGLEALKIRNERELAKFAETHPDVELPNPKIFEWGRLIELTYSTNNVKNKKWGITFYGMLEDEVCRMSQNQAYMFACLYHGFKLDQAEVGNIEWFGGNWAVYISDNHSRDYTRLVRQFFPEDVAANVIKDPFFRNSIKAMNGWRDHERNFRNSKVYKQVTYFDTVKHYEKIKEGLKDYTEEEAAGLAEQYFMEELEAVNHQTATVFDREVIFEKVRKRLLKETGYKYTRTDYDLDSSWIDEDLYEHLIYLIPEFCAALDEIDKMIAPNSVAGRDDLNIEASSRNPICNTSMYQGCAVLGFNNFLLSFNIENEDTMAESIYKKVKEVNRYRGVHYKEDAAFGDTQEDVDYVSPEEVAIKEIVNDIVKYYYSRKEILKNFLSEENYQKICL